MSQLIPALAGLAPIAAGVGLLALFGRDPHANEHDLSDYHEPTPANDAPRSLAHYEQLDRQDDVIWTELDEILPPAPAGTDAGGSPLYAAVTVDMTVPTLTDAQVRQRAADILRDLGVLARLELTR